MHDHGLNDTLLITTTPTEQVDALKLLSNQDPITLGSLNAFKKVCFKRVYFSFNKAKTFYQQKMDPVAFSDQVVSFKDFAVHKLGMEDIKPQESTTAVISSPHFTNAAELAATFPNTLLLNLSMSFEAKLRLVRSARVLVAMDGIEWGAFLHDASAVINIIPFGVASTHFLDRVASVARANNVTYLELEATIEDGDKDTSIPGNNADAWLMLENTEYRRMWLEQDTRIPVSVFQDEVQKALKTVVMWNGHCSSCASLPPVRSGEWCAEPTDDIPALVIFPYCRDGHEHETHVSVNM